MTEPYEIISHKLNQDFSEMEDGLVQQSAEDKNDNEKTLFPKIVPLSNSKASHENHTFDHKT